MSIDDIEAEVLKLDPQARARLARKLLESLETLSEEENERLWAEEADRRDAIWDLPGCVAVAETRAEVLRLIREAIELHIAGLKEDGLPVPAPSSEGEIVEVGAA